MDSMTKHDQYQETGFEAHMWTNAWQSDWTAPFDFCPRRTLGVQSCIGFPLNDANKTPHHRFSPSISSTPALLLRPRSISSRYVGLYLPKPP